MKFSLRVIRLTKFEYWPYWFFYFPFTLQWLYYSIRSFNLVYFTRSNHQTEFGGFFQYSKYGLIKHLQEKYIPKSKLYINSEELLSDKDNPIFNLPFIYKPDIGERGKGVTKFNSFDEIKNEINEIQFPCIIQGFIDLPIELGILFYRFPSGKKGITSVVSKDFLTVTGTGRLTLEELIQNEVRASNRIDFLKNKFKERWNQNIPKGEQLLLEEIGNHCRGTTFYDSRTIINDQLVEVMDEITKDIPGFHYGRVDLKCSSIEELYRGENIKIIEVNGVNSEANHIYDPKMSLFSAYGSVFENLEIVFKISEELRKKGIKPPCNFNQFFNAGIRHLKA